MNDRETLSINDNESETKKTLLDATVDVLSAKKDERPQSDVVRQSWYLAIGAVGIFSAYAGILNLQSSLNFDESIGTTSLAICFGTTIFMNATFVPVLLQTLGAKFLLLASDAAFVAYTIANLYPAKYTLYPAAVLLGIGESFIWPATMMFNAQFASKYISEAAERKSAEFRSSSGQKTCEYQEAVATKTRWFTGRFFAIFSAYQIIGSLLAYTILVFDARSANDFTVNSTERPFINLTEVEGSAICGAEDCYEYTEAETKEKLGVTSSYLRYTLFACYAVLQICSLALHKFLLTDLGGRDTKSFCNHRGFQLLSEFPAKIIRHMVSPLQLLIIPFNVYSGMMMAFIFGELTRSYISCPLGVEQIGLAMALFGVTAAIASFLFQWRAEYTGKNCFAGLCIVMEGSLLIFCRFWQPPIDGGSWQIYVIATMFGFPDSIRQAVIAATYPEYFTSDRDVAFSMASMLTACGYAVMFAVGTSICVITKIDIILSALAVSTVCYCIAEVYFHKIKKDRQ